jgi:hypothetical protein
MCALERRPGSSLAAALVALAGLALAGCLHDPTEIVLVVDSDLTPEVDFVGISFEISTPRSPPRPGMKLCGALAGASGNILPTTLGITPADSGSTEFNVIVKAIGRTVDLEGCPVTLVRRTFSNIRFVANEMKVLFIPILRRCECDGTTCAHALDTYCRDITEPLLEDFDEDHLPSVTSIPSATP